MSKMIKNELISASQIIAAFQHHWKVSRNKIPYDSSQKIKRKECSFQGKRKCHQEKCRAEKFK